jgi:hypothetical protein
MSGLRTSENLEKIRRCDDLREPASPLLAFAPEFKSTPDKTPEVMLRDLFKFRYVEV